MLRTNLVKVFVAACFAGLLCVTNVQAQQLRFDPSPLVKLGDKMRFGTHSIIKIGDGVFQINDRETVPRDSTAPQGSDSYLIVGEKSALLIDLGNDYITGVASQNLKPRPYAAEEFRAMVVGLAGGLPIDAVLSHGHVDHTGMTKAMIYPNITLWASDLEPLDSLKAQHDVDPSVFKRFTSGTKSFDLGGGRVVATFYVRGHTPGSTTFILKQQGLVFTGDAWGVGFGLGINSVDQLKIFASDSEKLVDYIKSNFAPYERYALRVYPAHSRYVGTMPWRDDKIPYYDGGYYDWRWLQEMSAAGNGVLKGLWLQKGSGLTFVEASNPAPGRGAVPAASPNQPPPSAAEKRYTFVYGTGSVSMTLKMAYEAAGLKLPE